MILDQINEAYINKTRRCLEMEKCIEKLRKKYMASDDLSTALGSNTMQTVASDSEWIKWQSLIEDESGFLNGFSKCIYVPCSSCD